jgi:hypothetical protein
MTTQRAPIESTTKKSESRRAVLIGALGGVGAMLAGGLARPQAARADGEAMVVGGEYNNALSVTSITNDTNSSSVFQAVNTSTGRAIVARSVTTTAISATSQSGTGVFGHSTTSLGVLGFSGSGLPVPVQNVGVYGLGPTNSASRGVFGRTGSGQGVAGQADSGVGLYGTATTGHALRTSGRIKADKVSGVATIKAGNVTKVVTPGVNVTASSFVLLTPKVKLSGRDLWFTTNASTNKFTIHISSTRSTATKVAWLLLG